MLHILISFLQVSGYVGIFVTMALESCLIPLPSEIILPYGGYLSSLGHLDFWLVVGVGTFGSLVGALIEYSMGLYGTNLVLSRYANVINVTPRKMEALQYQFRYQSAITLTVGRFIPYIRTFISLPAGIARMPVGRFSFFTVMGTYPWVLVFTWAGAYMGRRWIDVGNFVRPITAGVFLVTMVMFIIYAGRKVDQWR